MNQSNAQRTRAGTLRILLVLCILIILILAVLYFMKRVETSQLSRDLKILKETNLVERGHASNDLKICQTRMQAYQQQLEQSQTQLHNTKASHATATSDIHRLQSELTQAQADLKDSKDELDKCNTKNDGCQNSLSSLTEQLTQCKQDKDASESRVGELHKQVALFQSQLQAQRMQMEARQRSSQTSQFSKLPPSLNNQFGPTRQPPQQNLPPSNTWHGLPNVQRNQSNPNLQNSPHSQLVPQQATPSPVATPKLPSLPDHPAMNASNGGNEKPNVGDRHGSEMGEAVEEEGADQRPEQGNKDDAGDEDLKEK